MFRLTRREQAIVTGFLVLILIVSGIYMYGRPSLANDVPLPKLEEPASNPTGIQPTKPESSVTKLADIKVDVKGAVHVPGVYSLPAGSRVADALQAAGGTSQQANLDSLNLAQKLSDGAFIQVPNKEGQSSAAQPAGAAGVVSNGGANHKINVNTATAEQLDSLEGIGSTRAKAIVQHREQFGPFQKPEDLLKIKGLGPKLLETIKDRLEF
jgi:competence protein ComEA